MKHVATIAFLGLTSQAESFSPKRRSLGPAFLRATPKRLEDNVDGVLYVNDRCINCSACANFAPMNFKRATGDAAHVVYHQPSNETEILDSRAAMAACPVAAIRVETEAYRHHRGMESLMDHEIELAKKMALSPKLNGYELPFPRPLTHNVWYLGHHNEKSFGATPYLLYTSNNQWVMIDTPRFGNSAILAVKSLTGPNGPDYLVLTHVDDTADHGKWADEFPSLRRVFHHGDLGIHNWLGDSTLADVEILLGAKSMNAEELQAFDLDGTNLTKEKALLKDLVVYHTPGHSPGSISLYDRISGVLFTGDTLGYSNRVDTLTGFPRYGNNRALQAQTLRLIKELDWALVAPGHGHIKEYGAKKELRNAAIDDAIRELVKIR